MRFQNHYVKKGKQSNELLWRNKCVFVCLVHCYIVTTIKKRFWQKRYFFVAFHRNTKPSNNRTDLALGQIRHSRRIKL